jgi:DNA-directed RNA polymerase specialized sigma subunit
MLNTKVENVFNKELVKLKKIKTLEKVLLTLKRSESEPIVKDWVLELDNQISELTVASGLFWSYVKSDRLDELEKAVLISYFYDGQSYRKIANLVGYRSHNSVKQIIKQALKKLN